MRPLRGHYGGCAAHEDKNLIVREDSLTVAKGTAAKIIDLEQSASNANG